MCKKSENFDRRQEYIRANRIQLLSNPLGVEVVSPRSKSKNVLYFIDESVSDINTIVNAIPASAEVRVIGFGEDAVVHLQAALADKRDISAVHLVSHGRPGAIVLGASVIDATTLATRAEDFLDIGRSLAPDADLIVYGCRVAEGESGKAFLAKLADLTGSNVAASETLTGAAHLGGNWDLEVRLGNVRASTLSVPSYADVLAAPNIGSLAPISYIEGDAAQSIGTVTFTDGSGYAGGSITFGVSGATANDQMTLFSDGNPDETGAISRDASGNVYYGNGAGRDLIGKVDDVQNGQNGQPLTIHLIGTSTNAITNPSFEGSTSGWTIVKSRVILGTTEINGHVTPVDPTAPPNSTNGAGGGIDNGGITSMTYNSGLATDQHTDGGSSLRLYLSGNTSDGFDVVHGPYAYSDTFAAQAGDVFAFDWRAAAGGDAYDAFGYLMNADTGEYVRVLDATGENDTGVTNWASQKVVVPESGNWFFVFVAGTYDFTGGRAVGGSLYIDNFRVERSPVNDTVLGELAKHVQYQNTSDAPPDDPRTLTIEVKDGTGDIEKANTTIDITPVNDAPVVSGAVAGAATEGGAGVTLDALKNASDVDADDVLTVVDVGTLPAGVTYDAATHSFALDPAHPAYQSLAAGAAQTVTVEYSVSDGTAKVPASVSWTVTGTNDAAALSSDTRELTEADAVLTTSGTLTISDVDSPETFVPQTGTDGQYGTFAIGTDGKWTYVTFSAHNEFRAGETYTETFPVTSADGTTTTVTVKITGTNDAAQLSADVATLTEGDTAAALSTSGQLTIADVDSPATFIAQSNVAGQYGMFSIGADGKWTYEASSAHDEFQVGQVYTEIFTVTSSDGTTTTVTVRLTGTNDAASGRVDVIGDPTQGKVLTATNNVVDPEGIAPSSVAYQWQRQQANGTWVNITGATGTTYALTQADVDAGHVRVVMTYTDLGGSAEQVSGDAIPVANVNDTPTGAVAITGEAREGQLLTAVNTLADDDGLGTLTYQWMADGVAIHGATGSTLTLARDHVGKAITVVVSYTDGYGTPEFVSSPASSVVVEENAGDDRFYGGSGNDELFGGTGNDWLYGYGGRDKLFGEAGNDTIDGGADNDTLDGGSGDDLLFGNDGRDRLYGNSGRDTLFGGADHDTISGGADSDILKGQSGNDWLYGDAGTDTLYGGIGNDRLYGGSGHDRLLGEAGHDRLDGGTGNDTLLGGTGNDTLVGGTGHDRLYGDAGHDRLYGEIGNDRLDGGSGHDRLDGGTGNDTLLGGIGNDTLLGGAGRDKMWGGSGKDVFVFTSAKDSQVGSQRDVIYDFQSGHDTIDLRGIDANTRLAGNQAFSWSCMDVAFVNVGEADAAFLSAGFTGKAGQLRFANGILSGDIDGDRRADFEIKIVGHFSSADVIL
ncbi:DUF4347 domain-containing protein [Microvirga sp. TS319]|uniref:VCBS domain-containing protein n=1 Tax=Microvirga sp. TS319 TaxID=3241165 RepID=UPI00351A0387